MLKYYVIFSKKMIDEILQLMNEGRYTCLSLSQYKSGAYTIVTDRPKHNEIREEPVMYRFEMVKDLFQLQQFLQQVNQEKSQIASMCIGNEGFTFVINDIPQTDSKKYYYEHLLGCSELKELMTRGNQAGYEFVTHVEAQDGSYVVIYKK